MAVAAFNRPALREQLEASLRSDVAFLNFREATFAQMCAQKARLEYLVRGMEARPAPPVERLVDACRLTRTYWGCFLSSALALRPPGQLREEFECVLPLLARVVQMKDKLLAACPDTEREAAHYIDNMEMRLGFLNSDLVSPGTMANDLLLTWLGPAGLSGNLSEAERTDPILEEDQWLPATLLCVAFWSLHYKLAAWGVELAKEAGPHALCISDHCNLISGALDLFRILIDVARSASGPSAGGSLDDAFRLADKTLVDLRNRIADPMKKMWREINDTRPIDPDADSLDVGALKHPLDPNAEAFLRDTINPDVQDAELTIRRNWMRLQSELPDGVWAAWREVSMQDILPLPAVGAGAAADEMQRILHVSWDRAGVRRWLKAVLSGTSGAGQESGEMACLLLGRLLEIDRESAKEMFRGMLLKPVSRDLGPPGVFHIQAAGTLMGTMARNPQSHRSDVPWVERLMEEVWTADPEIYGGKQLRNALVASLLGLDYAISGSSLDDALGLRTLTQRCLDRVGDDRLRLYFLQTLAEDLTLLLPDLEDGSNVAKFLMLAGILRPEALRWSDPAILNRLDRVRAEITAPPV